MFATVIVISLYCLGVGAGVLRANPRRFPNQVFALISLLAAAWIGCVAGAIAMGERFFVDGLSSPVPWLRANGAISALLPWATLLLVDAVCGERSRGAALRRSLPLLTLCAAAASLCLTEIYIPSWSTPIHQARGAGYTMFCALGLAVYGAILGYTLRQTRRQTGLRRVEMTFLALNIAITFPLVIVLTAIGNAMGLQWCRRSSLFVILASFTLSGWALTFHRMYDARQIIVSLAQRLAVVAALAGSVWATSSLLTHLIPAPAELCIAVVICTPVAFWLDAKLRGWLDLDGARRLAAMRRSLIEVSRTEPSTEQLIATFERLIAADQRASFVTLLVGRGETFARGERELRKDTAACAWLAENGWATTESLDRARPSPGARELQRYMAQQSLGLIIAVPAGAPTPSLLIALGIKKTGWPFTYPEVQRTREIGAMIDNILVRSRLIAEEGLKAKVDHLAMMSRGLAHDLKNLITPISSFLVHTHGHYAEGTAEEEVHNAARRSVTIIGDYISEALFFAKRLTPKFETVELSQLMAAVIEITASRAARRGVAVVTVLERTASFVADGVLMQRLLINLANNAIDASAAGANVEVIVTNGRPGCIRLQVRDDGVGIPSEHTERIFEPYFTTKQFGDDVRGFGLGLTICDKIVALHHGTISVRSVVGVGTTVTVDLPDTQPPGTEPLRDISVATRSPFAETVVPPM